MEGGAVWCVDGAAPLLDNCIFKDNAAVNDGGAICSSWGWAEITDCRFLSNSAAHGGAVAVVAEGTVRLEGSLFYGNSADDGGAIYMYYWGESQIGGSTIVMNEADRGSGISILDPSWGPFGIERTIVAFNSGGEGVYWGGSGDLTMTCNDLFGNEGGDWVGNIAPMIDVNGNFSVDPCFCAAEEGDFTLCADSFCLPGEHSWACPELVGAYGAGCDDCDCMGPIRVEAMSWGEVKNAYR